MTNSFNGHKWKIDPFPPGHFEEYELHEDGTVKLLSSKRFYTIGDIPKYRPFVSYEGNLLYSGNIFCL